MESVIAGIVGTVVGALASGYFALRAARGQVEAAMRQVRGGVSDRLYQTNRALLEYLARYPSLRPYFFDRKPLADCRDEEERNRVLLSAAMVADLLELIVLDLPDLPESVRERWKQFAIDSHCASPALQAYLDDFGHWYSPLLLELLRKPSAASPRPISEGR